MKFEKNSPERQMFAEYYELCEKWWDVTPDKIDDDMWVEIVRETNLFCGKYSTQDDKFATHLVTLLISRIECIQRHVRPLCDFNDGTRMMLGALMDWRLSR